jgi:hypothetical protein
VSGKLGSVIITCPGCGEPLEASIFIKSLSMRHQDEGDGYNNYKAIDVNFIPRSILHPCPGRH